MLLKQLLIEGAREVALEDFIKKTIAGTEWEGKVFIAGGYVRDLVMGKDPKDLDIMVNEPDGGIKFSEWITKKVGSYKEGSNPVIFPRFGTAKFNLGNVVHNGQEVGSMDIEAVMPRSEKYTSGSRKPEVGYTSLQGDAERRDLTANALFKNISTGEILDLTGKGMKDIEQGVIRTPLEPSKTFTDDPLRMLRVVRFYAKYNWKIPTHIIRALKANAQQLEKISPERIQEELNKMLVTSSPDKAIKLLKVVDLLQYVIPEMKQAIKMTQNQHHTMDVFGHTLAVLKKTKPILAQRLMGLFHDIGKIVTRSVTPTGVHFYGHEDAGVDIAEKIMKRLKYPNEVIDAVKVGIKNHMRLKQGGDTAVNLTDKTLRKFVADVGDQLENVLSLIHADNIAHADASAMPNQIDFVKTRLKSLETTTAKPKLPINGFDLQKELGLKPGKQIGDIMKAITDAWFENPKLSREDAMNIARNFVSNQPQKEVNEIIEKFKKLANIKENIDINSIRWEKPIATHPDEIPLDLDVAKVDAAWSKDKDMYIGPGGTCNPKRGCYQGFVSYLQRGEPIGMPQISWGEWSRCIQFTNGRHRFAVLRDMGLKKIPAMVPKEQLDFFKQNFV